MFREVPPAFARHFLLLLLTACFRRKLIANVRRAFVFEVSPSLSEIRDSFCQLYHVNLSDKDAQELESESYSNAHFWNSRARAIAWLHRSAVGHFLETPDFGVLRMGYPALRHLENGDGTPIELPSMDNTSPHVPSSEDFANNNYDVLTSGDIPPADTAGEPLTMDFKRLCQTGILNSHRRIEMWLALPKNSGHKAAGHTCEALFEVACHHCDFLPCVDLVH